MKYTVSVNKDGEIVLAPHGRDAVRPTMSELGSVLEAMRRGRSHGAELASAPMERAEAAAQLVRTLMVEPSIPEILRGVVIGAALAKADADEPRRAG